MRSASPTSCYRTVVIDIPWQDSGHGRFAILFDEICLQEEDPVHIRAVSSHGDPVELNGHQAEYLAACLLQLVLPELEWRLAALEQRESAGLAVDRGVVEQLQARVPALRTYLDAYGAAR